MTVNRCRWLSWGRCAQIALLIAWLSLLSCGGQDPGLNVILIGVDTLRPDHLGCYGYDRDTSPNIDALAREGVLFETVVSQAPWTLPSFATVLTSLYPTQNGTCSFMNRMRTGFPTLAGILSAHSYATGAIINVPLLRTEFGVLRGFEHQDVLSSGKQRRADQVTQDALDWIDTVADRPFFLFAHYFDPHHPYGPPAPYDTLFDPGYRGRIGNTFDIKVVGGSGAGQTAEMMALSAEDWNHIKSLYDGEIAFLDVAIGALMRGLDRRGIKERTIVVFLSDHGEEFYDHGSVGHGHTLFNELIRVPLIISLPKTSRRGARISRQVRLVDVAPTILDLAGIGPDAHFEGVSLAPLLTGEGSLDRGGDRTFPSDVGYSEAMQRVTEKKAVSRQSRKLIYDLAGADRMFFDLEQDPNETTNLASAAPEPMAAMGEILFKNLLSMSGTWYIELAGDGTSHDFDIKIVAGRGSTVGRIHPCRLSDGRGRAISPGRGAAQWSPAPEFELRDLGVDGSAVLAFKSEAPLGVPVTFDLKIDGVSASDRTFIGESLKSPRDMPFSRQAGRARTESVAGPKTRPVPPYFLIWHTGGSYGAEASVTLKDDTKRELRALGYIQ